MDARQREFWFPAKRYGWGWGLPVAWQGWAVLIAYAALLAAGAMLLLPERRALFVAHAAVVTALLVLVCWLKGEKPRWRWGDKG